MDAALPDWMSHLEQLLRPWFPALAALAILLVLGGVINAWRAQSSETQKARTLGRQVLRALRRQPAGATADSLARELQVAPHRLAGLLEELQRKRRISSHTTSDRRTMWVIRD